MSISDSGSSSLINQLSKSTSSLSSAFQRLSSGKRINKASDDAAGLAVVSALESDVRTSLQGSRNSSDGISIADITESALNQVSDITGRQQELAAQSANGTLSDTQRASLNDEFQALESEKQRIFSTTEFNGVNVFSGQSTTLQVGTTGDSSSQVSLPGISTSSLSNSSSIATQAGAQSAIDSLKSTQESLAKVQGEIGSSVSRVSIAGTRAQDSATESEAAASRIRDADVADEAANLTASRIRQQTTTALIAQAGKISGDSVLKLLS